jgi:hypothetical protein
MYSSTHSESYDSTDLEGWTLSWTQRKHGATVGKYDTYFHSPDQRKFRSLVEVEHYLNTIKYPNTKKLLAALTRERKETQERLKSKSG